MKKLTLVIPVLIFGVLTFMPAQAQTIEIISVTEEAEISDKGNRYSTFFDFGRKHNSHKCYSRSYSPQDKMPKRWKWHGGHWAGVGIYYNGLVQNIGNLTLPSGAEYMSLSPKSIGVNINFIDFTLVSNRHFGLITGLGLEMNNFRFKKNIELVQDQNGVVVPDYSYDTQGINLSKSKLTTIYMNIPLLVEFQFGNTRNNGRGSGFVSFGAIAGLRLNGHTKVQYYDGPEDKQTIKQNKGLNLRNFHYGAEFNIGYRCIALSARYYPHSIFIDKGGPEVQQVNVGLSLLF